MRKTLVSRMIRLNRKLAWLLAIFTVIVILTGYGPSLRLSPRRGRSRSLHLAAEWAFIALLAYHLVVGFLLLPFRWRSMLRRVKAGPSRFATSIRLGLRLTCWPLFALSLVVILSGLSWYGIYTIGFNRHLEVDSAFLLVFVVHTVIGGLAAGRRFRRSS